MGLKLDLKEETRIDAFSADSLPHAGTLTLPEWLRAEWVEPVIVAGDRLGTIVVLPEPFGGAHRGPRRSAAAPSGSDMKGDGSIDQIIGRTDVEELIGVSAEFKRTMQQVALVGPTEATVLITGETGTERS